MRQDSPVSAAASRSSGEAIPPHLRLERLREHPRLAEAMRGTAAELVGLHSRGRLVRWFLSDRVLAVLTHIAVGLDADASDDDPRSGLTPGRFKAFCVACGLCSEGRAAAILAYMRLSGQLESETHPTDRRATRLRPSRELLETMRSRLRTQYAGAALLCPELEPVVAQLDCRSFKRRLAIEFLRRYSEGARVIDRAPQLRLFAERDVGMLVLFALMLQAGDDDPLPPVRPVPLSIAALSRQFQVSRTHILRLVRDAESAGLVERRGDKGEQIAFSPRLREGLRDLFAAMYQLAALCAFPALAAGPAGASMPPSETARTAS